MLDFERYLNENQQFGIGRWINASYRQGISQDWKTIES